MEVTDLTPETSELRGGAWRRANIVTRYSGYRSNTMLNVRFSQRCWWEFKCSGILRNAGWLHPEEGGSTLLRNVSNSLPVDTV